jgi:hypothetical protein
MMLIVDPETLDSTSYSDDGVPKIILMSSDSDVEEFYEFEPVLDIVGLGGVDFEDLDADKPRNK